MNWSSGLHTWIFSILLTALFFNFLLSSASQPSYADHCQSVVPEPSITKYEAARLSSFPFQTGYYDGGSSILSQNPSEGLKSLTFQPQRVYRTDQDGVFSIYGILEFASQSILDSVYIHARSIISFRLEGLWSESSGNLCMVGNGYFYTKERKAPKLQVVLKLSNLRNSSSNITTLVTGTMESLSSLNALSYFEPISVMLLPSLNYVYTLVSKESGKEFSGADDTVKGLPINSLPSKSFCSILPRVVNEFKLRYTGDCDSSKNCGPFGAAVGFLPTTVSFEQIQCLEEEKRMRVLVGFPSGRYTQFYQPFNLTTTLIGEALWDYKINQLCIVACRFFNTTGSLSNAQVGDCTTRLRLGFPAIWSIRDTSNVVGKIWSKKSVNNSGYFNEIMFQSSRSPFRTFLGRKYEYTEMEKVRSSCWPKGKLKKNKGKGFPNSFSNDMRFDMWVKSSKINPSWGNAAPLFVGDQFYNRYAHLAYSAISPNSRISGSAVQANLRDDSPVNISYLISINLRSNVSWGYEILKFSAEGIYDVETGKLCMVGCRNLVPKNQSLIHDSIDCEVLINFQFPPSNLKMNEGYIEGSIKSTRVKSDSLYFEKFDVISRTYTTPGIKNSIRRMDLEIVIAVITNTLACVFVGLQLFHVKKHPDVLRFISISMLFILTLGHMLALLLNFEALLQKTVVLGSNEWFEVNQVLVRTLTMVAFLMEVRLLQISWSARSAGENPEALWFAEKSTLLISLPLYAAGALILLLVSRRNRSHDDMLLSFRLTGPQRSLWKDFKSYAGLVSDGFLLPQILLNAFRNSKENVLSSSFCLGTTFIRLLPHAYDLYRGHSYTSAGSYLYAASNSDFYSTAWDVIMPLGGLLFAGITLLQQRLGGQCIVPKKFWVGEQYEKVPVVSESQLPEKSSPSDEKISACADSDLEGNE